MEGKPKKMILFPSKLNTKKSCPKNGGTGPCFCHPKMPSQTPKVALLFRPPTTRGKY